MKKIIFLLLIVSILSCQSKPSLNGIWEIAYEISPENKISTLSNCILFDFEKDHFSIVEFEQYDTALVDQFNYKINDSRILYRKGTDQLVIEIESIHKDSLLLKPHNSLNSFMLKRVKKYGNKNVSNKELVDRTFQFEAHNFLFTFDFVNDTLIYAHERLSSSRWAIINYKDYSFLSTTIPLIPPCTISKNEHGQIYLNEEYTSSMVFHLEELSKHYKKEQIIGDWIEFERSFPPPLFIQEDTLLNRNFLQTKLISKRFGRKRIDEWKLSGDGKYIYSYNENGYFYKPEKITRLTSDTLILTTHPGYLDSTEIKFTRNQLCCNH